MLVMFLIQQQSSVEPEHFLNVQTNTMTLACHSATNGDRIDRGHRENHIVNESRNRH